MTYKIYEPNLKPLTDKLTRLNAKLIKIGAAPVTYALDGHSDEPSPENPAKLVRYYKLNVEGDAPTQNGWDFVATIVHTDDGNIIRSVPGYEVPTVYRDHPTNCDHCKVNRQRNDTYIVRSHADSSTQQVGSSCLEDFIGVPAGQLTKATEHLLNAFSVCDAAQNRAWLGGTNTSATYRIDLDTFLAAVAAVVLKDGRYVTRKQANESGVLVATSDKARSVLENPALYGYEVTPAATALAEAARNYVLNTYSPALADPSNLSDAEIMSTIMNSFKATNLTLTDFQHNLLACARAEAIEPRLGGIAAYIVEAYRRAQPKPETARLNKDGMVRIFQMFKHAKDSLLKFPGIRLSTEAGLQLNLSLAGLESRNAGSIYVKGARGAGAYYGKIAPDGSYYPVQAASPEVGKLLLEFAAEPEKVAAAYGKRTGCCCFCSRKLTDVRSTEVGYGETCAKHFNVTYPKHAAPIIPVLEVAAVAA